MGTKSILRAGVAIASVLLLGTAIVSASAADRRDDHRGGDPLALQARLQGVCVQRRDGLVGDDGGAAARRQGRKPRAGVADQAGSDAHLIAAAADRYAFLVRVLGFSPSSSV